MIKIILAWFDAIKMELEMTYEEQDVMEILRKRVTLINFWLVMKALTNETFMFENKEWLWIDDLEVKTENIDYPQEQEECYNLTHRAGYNVNVTGQ